MNVHERESRVTYFEGNSGVDVVVDVRSRKIWTATSRNDLKGHIRSTVYESSIPVTFMEVSKTVDRHFRQFYSR